MTPERATRIYEIFQAVLECAPSDRAALLDAMCGADLDVRTEVEKLLSDDERASRDNQRGL